MKYKNRFGVTIKKCCASCANCTLALYGNHRCSVKKEETLPQFVCADWRIKPKLMNAGMGTGVVRSKEEMMAVQQQRLKDGTLTTNYSQMK